MQVLSPLVVKVQADNDKARALCRGIGHCDHVAQEAPYITTSIRCPTVLDVSSWGRKIGYFDKTVHRPEILADYAN